MSHRVGALEPRPAGPRPLEGRLVVLGVTGSIAAYKAAELARALIAAGAEVQVVMTQSASHFLGPLTLETLTRRRCSSTRWSCCADSRIGHIVAADTADLVVVAPATARWLAAMATGLADDVVTAICLATRGAGRGRTGHGRRDVVASGHPRQRRRGCAASATRSSSPTSGPLASGAEGRGGSRRRPGSSSRGERP